MGKDIYSVVATQLRLKRLQAGWTLEKLAAAADISTSFLAHLESSKKKPSLATIAKIASALGISVSELFKEAPVETEHSGYPKNLKRVFNILRNQTPADTEVMISMLTALSKSLHKHKTG